MGIFEPGGLKNIIMSYVGHRIFDILFHMKQYIKTRQSEMANTSPRQMPVLGNVHPIKIENFDIFRDVISLLKFLYY